MLDRVVFQINKRKSIVLLLPPPPPPNPIVKSVHFQKAIESRKASTSQIHYHFLSSEFSMNCLAILNTLGNFA